MRVTQSTDQIVTGPVATRSQASCRLASPAMSHEGSNLFTRLAPDQRPQARTLAFSCANSWSVMTPRACRSASLAS